MPLVRRCCQPTRISSAFGTVSKSALAAQRAMHSSPITLEGVQPRKALAWAQWRLAPPCAAEPSSRMLAHHAEGSRRTDEHGMARLPVPSLQQTLGAALTSAAPLAKTASELNKLKMKEEAFASGQAAKALQAALQKRREQPETLNWLAEWWDTSAYMAYRDSVVVNVSYYFGFSRLPQSPPSASLISTPGGPATPSTEPSDPTYVAASLASTALEFRNLIARGLLEPESAGKGGGALCMEGYKWLFNSCRVPASPSDYGIKIAETDTRAQHIVAIRRGRLWRVDLADKHGRPLDVLQLKKQFQSILDEDKRLPEARPVGAITGGDRDSWANMYAALEQASPKNRGALDAVETAAFVVCLSDSQIDASADPVGFSSLLWKCGDGESSTEIGTRWWDKPLQFVVTDSGEAGFIGEHSMFDGQPSARMCDFITKRLLQNEPTPVGAADKEHADGASKPVALEFDLPPMIENALDDAVARFRSHVAGYKVAHTLYTRYGKDKIKQCGTSPDSWVQMAFQLAYRLTNNEICATYEAAQVRRFRLGRTETVRTCTSESADFVAAMLDSGRTDDARRVLFRKAVERHGRDMRLASAGQGIDRHLFGLRKILPEVAPTLTEKDKQVAEAFLNDELLARSATWKMSTSQIYIRHSPTYGWGPVVDGGYGLPYMIHPESLQLSVTTQKDVDGQALVDNFCKACDMILELMDSPEAHEQRAKQAAE